MNQPFTHTHEHAMHMWGKCSDDCRKLLATQAKLLAACKSSLAEFERLTEEVTSFVEDEPVELCRTAIAEAEGDTE